MVISKCNTFAKQNRNIMKAKDLKVGSVLQIKVNISCEQMQVETNVKIDRVSDTYIWFKSMGYERVGRNTIDKYPTLYKIISL